MSDPKYVRLNNELVYSRSLVVDTYSHWSISGLDVKAFPDPERHPAQAEFVRDALRRGLIEVASQAEFEEVQAAHKFDGHAAAGVSLKPLEVEGATHNEANLVNAADAAASDMERRRLGLDNNQEAARLEALIAQQNEADAKAAAKSSK
jgi:hypothetical protein